MKKITPILSLAFGLAIVILGFVAYASAQSHISLIIGSCFGAFMMISAIFMFKNRPAAFYSGLTFSAILFISFLFRFFKTHASMPLIMTILSAFMSLLIIFRVAQITKENKG